MEELEDTDIVYITSHGEKFHIDLNCLYIQGKKTKNLSLKKAKEMGKAPCKGCCFNNNNNFQQNNNKNENKKKLKNKNYYFYQKQNKKQNPKNKYVKNFINSEDADNIIFNNSLSNSQQLDNKNEIKIINNENNESDSNEDEKEKVININSSKEDEKENYSQKEERKNESCVDYNNNKFNTNKKENENKFDNTSQNKNNLNNNISNSSNNSDSSDNNSEINEKKNLKKNIQNNNNNKIININNNNYTNNENMIENENYGNIQNFLEKQKDKNINVNYNFYNEKKIENEKSVYDESDFYGNVPKNSIESYKKPLINDKAKLSPIFSSNNSINKNDIQQNQLNQYALYKNNNIENNFYYKLNCGKNDMFVLEETYYSAKTLSFEKKNEIIEENSINEKEINGREFVSNGNYKFKFEMNPLNEENNSFTKISVGFKIKYQNSQDIHCIIDEKLINMQNINFKIGSLYDSLKLQKHFMIFKKTGIINVLLNITKGKFFVVGKDELIKRKQNIFLNKINTEIFFIKNFYPIPIRCLKCIEPIFHFDKKSLKNFEIKINDKRIKYI